MCLPDFKLPACPLCLTSCVINICCCCSPEAIFYIKSTEPLELADNSLSSCLLHKKNWTVATGMREDEKKRGKRPLKKRLERNPLSFSLSPFVRQEKGKRRLGSALKALKKPRSPPGQICEMRKWLKGQEAGGR